MVVKNIDVKSLVTNVFDNLNDNISQTTPDLEIEKKIDAEYKNESPRTKKRSMIEVKVVSSLMNKHSMQKEKRQNTMNRYQQRIQYVQLFHML